MIWFADVSQVLCGAMLTLGRLSRVVARQARNARGVRNKSKAELVAETEQLSRTAGALLDCPVNRDVLGRVTLVEDTSHSAHLVESMLAAAAPVAVDMEGVEGGSVTSLVQVCDHHRNISLFRTGRNPALYRAGRLAELLETPRLLKIMHGSSVDCLSVYRDGVKMWNVFDTALAFKVLQFQLTGASMHTSNQIGFNKLCELFSIPQNPVKERKKNILWRMIISQNGKRGLDTADVIDDETVLYCAWDVEPLHALHSQLCGALAPDWGLQLARQLSELELLRALDPRLGQARRRQLRLLEESAIFLSGLPDFATPAQLYSLLVDREHGHRQLYWAGHTAVLVLDSRQQALDLADSFPDWAAGLEGAQCRPVVPLHSNQVVAQPSEMGATRIGLAGDQIGEERRCCRLVAALLHTCCPVVIEFHQQQDRLELELYAGPLPAARLPLTQAAVERVGLAPLLASPQVVKVVGRLDTGSLAAGLQTLAKLSLPLHNVFCLTAGVNSIDYLTSGQSLCQQAGVAVAAMPAKLGLCLPPGSPRLQQKLLVYLHLQQVLPAFHLTRLARLAEAELDVGRGGPGLHAAKQDRTAVKKELDEWTLHLRLCGQVDRGRRQQLCLAVRRAATGRGLQLVNYTELDRAAMVTTTSAKARRGLAAALDSQQTDLNFRLTSPSQLNTVVDRPATTPVKMDPLLQIFQNNVDRLLKSGSEGSWEHGRNFKNV